MNKKKILIYLFLVTSISLIVTIIFNWYIGIILFLLLSLRIGMYVANHFIKKTAIYRSYWGGADKFWTKIPFNLEFVNLGSSSACHAFHYADKSKGMNWAIGPQSLQHDFNILKNYFSYIQEGGFVIITLCPFSCLDSSYSKATNLKYYTFLHPRMVINFEEKERTKALKAQQKPILHIPLFLIKSCINTIKTKIRNSIQPHKDFDTQANIFINAWKNQFGISNLEMPLSTTHTGEQKQKSKLLTGIIDFCKERNLNPILVIPPIHPTLSNKFSDAFVQNYIYNFIEQSDRNIPFYNFMNSTLFMNDSFYENPFFMNQKGAKLFTQELIKEIKKR